VPAVAVAELLLTAASVATEALMVVRGSAGKAKKAGSAGASACADDVSGADAREQYAALGATSALTLLTKLLRTSGPTRWSLFMLLKRKIIHHTETKSVHVHLVRT
jgi:hypothetical protein